MTRIIPPSHRSITGSLPTRFPERQLHYESKLERDFLIFLEIDHEIEAVVTQPITIDIFVDGRRRRYTPDVLAIWWDDVYFPYGKRRVIFEVKPRSVLKKDYEKLAPKYRAAKAYFEARGVGFRVITDRSIYCPRQANAALIGPAMRRPLSQDIISTVRAILTYPGVASRSLSEVRKLLVADGLLRDTAQQALLHMLGMRYLVADLAAPIGDETRVRWWADVIAEEAALETD
ncbi:TnsA endonuclease N-terminal domain-containing protein [Segnochrobactrum spirostomi]|uniref:TnsA endonuclease N-terminal domain-containing protein n=1 Tax=Segnochrobactrum spirostomi TaxID=2608987 RepID=UPI001AD84377|nr:TnsA endonuclease N-terminal domain-containing protein [Segnochrobactrum spirostomi]